MAPTTSAVALCSSMVANVATIAATFPLDTIKTRQQTATGAIRPNYTTGLFRGVSPALLFTTPCSGMYFATFEYLQSRYNAAQTFPGDLRSACLAQILPGTLLVPGDILKVNMQAGVYPNLRAALYACSRQINWRQTLAAMRTKLLLSYFRDFSFATIQMTLYVHCHRQGDHWSLFAGAIAAGTASLITTPLDTLRTRHMLAVDSGMKAATMAEANYFAGTAPRVALAAFSGLIFFRCYELCKPRIQRGLGPRLAEPSLQSM